MGRGIKLTDLNNGQMGAMMPEVVVVLEVDGWMDGCQVNCHRCGLLTIIGIQVIYPAYYDNNND